MARSSSSRRLPLLLGAAVAGVALAELLCRLVAPEPAALRREEAVYFRFRFPPEGQVVKLASRPGRELLYEIGPDGFRGRLAAVPERKAGKRVLVLGSASAFGLGLGEQETFPAQLERRLRSVPGCGDAEVLNAGAPGANATDMVGRYLSDLQRFAPDAVLVYHDWMVLPTLADGRSHETQAEEARTAFRAFPESGPFAKLALLRFLRRQVLRARFGQNLHQGNYSAVRPLGAPPAGTAVSEVPEAGLRQYAAVLRALVAGAQAGGAKAFLVPELTLAESASPEARARVWVSDRFTDSARLDALAKLRAVMRETARTTGATLIDLHGTVDGLETLLVDHVHLNPGGARVLAERVSGALARTLCRASP